MKRRLERFMHFIIELLCKINDFTANVNFMLTKRQV